MIFKVQGSASSLNAKTNIIALYIHARFIRSYKCVPSMHCFVVKLVCPGELLLDKVSSIDLS